MDLVEAYTVQMRVNLMLHNNVTRISNEDLVSVSAIVESYAETVIANSTVSSL